MPLWESLGPGGSATSHSRLLRRWPRSSATTPGASEAFAVFVGTWQYLPRKRLALTGFSLLELSVLEDLCFLVQCGGYKDPPGLEVQK